MDRLACVGLLQGKSRAACCRLLCLLQALEAIKPGLGRQVEAIHVETTERRSVCASALALFWLPQQMSSAGEIWVQGASAQRACQLVQLDR